eukprot:EG_transcript_2035
MWNETSCRELIATSYEWFLEQWDEYKIPIQHADVCRYFILHRFGGLYADLDIKPLRSLKPFLEQVASEGKEVRMLEKDNQDFAGETMCIGLMASVQGAAFWDGVFTSLQHRRYRWFYHLSPHVRVIMSTGPQVVMPVVRAQRHKVGVFPAQQFYACGPCSPLPCQREEGWVAFEEGGLSWNQWDTMILNALDCYVSHPFICIFQKYTIPVLVVLYFLTMPVVWWLCRVARDAKHRFAPTWQRWVAQARKSFPCTTLRKNACRFKRLLKATLAALMVFVLYTSVVLQGSTAAIHKCRPRLCEGRQRVLFVTAHPDDESMFFAPTIQECAARGNEVHLLCLSNGNAAGLGDIREKEMQAAADVLGVLKTTTVNDTALQDGPLNAWESQAIQNYVHAYITAHNITNLVTFDEEGVSGHPNHLAVHTAMVALHRKHYRRGTQFYQLDSVGLLRKFSGVIDLPLSLFESIDGETFTGSLWVSWQAMQQHTSQFVWFRRLFVIFSRYTYVNTVRNFNTVLYRQEGQCSQKGRRVTVQ